MMSPKPEKSAGSSPVRSGEASTPTMRDVAELAGVSVATVSHVVNQKPGARIGENARRRVREAIQTLGYRPNMLAKTLSNGTSRFIGFIADSIATTPFAGQIIRGAQDEAWRNGYILLVANTDGNRRAEGDAISMMLEHQVHGVLYSTWRHQQVKIPSALRETDAVLIDCFAPGSGLAGVVPNEEQGGRAATEMLLKAGHTRVAFINTTVPSPAQTYRAQGYRAALADAGLTVDPELELVADPNQEGGYEVTGALLATGATGVFCHNDRVAMGLYDGLRERGLSVPDDMSVVGFDNQEVIAAHLRPPLTTVALPHYELGVAGVRILLGHDAAPSDGSVLVGCPAVQRSSISSKAAQEKSQ